MTVCETIRYAFWWLYITVSDIVHIIIDYLKHREELLQNANCEHISFKVVIAEPRDTRDSERYMFTPATSYTNVDALQQYMIRQTFDPQSNRKNSALDQLIKRRIVGGKNSNENAIQQWFNDSVNTIKNANRDGLLLDKNGNVSTVPRLDSSVQNTEVSTMVYEHPFDESSDEFVGTPNSDDASSYEFVDGPIVKHDSLTDSFSDSTSDGSVQDDLCKWNYD